MTDALKDPYMLAKFRALRRDANEATADFLAKRYEHCRERFTDRFGISMSREDWDILCLALFLETDDVEYLDRGDSDEANLYVVRYRGVRFLCAFLETSYTIVTVFPRSDARLVAHGRGMFIPKENQSDASGRFRDEKLSLREPLTDGHLDSTGALSMEWPTPQVAQLSAAPALPSVSPFAVLADLKPRLDPQLHVASRPPVSADIAARFAELDRAFAAEERAIEQLSETRDARITDLERQLREARAGDHVFTVRTTMLSAARQQARDTFEQHCDGVISAADAILIADYLGARSLPVLPPKKRRGRPPSADGRGVSTAATWARRSPEERRAIADKRLATIAANRAARVSKEGQADV